MSYEEKGVWVYLVAGVISYGVYLALVLGQATTVPLAETDYAVPLLASIGISIGLSIVGRILLEIVKPSESYRSDDRDRAIDRLGDARGQWALIAAALGALVLALLDAPTFWIANVVYLGFVLSGILAFVAKSVMYRRGLPTW